MGVAVIRCRNSSAIDIVRNTLASEALRRGCESIMFIDADISFDPWDALRLFARPEPAVAGIYLKKGKAELTSSFPSEIEQVILGPTVQGFYPLEHTAAGFLRIHTSALRLMIEKLDLPLCNSDWGSGFWPFFLPMIVNRDGKSGSPHYLSEDFAFSHRLREIGVTPMADTLSRLFHHGSHGYTWEDAGSIPRRIPNHLLSIKKASEEGETTNQDKHQNRGQQKTAPV